MLMSDEAKTIARGLQKRDPDLLDRLIEQYQYRLFRYLLYITGNKERAEALMVVTGGFFNAQKQRLVDLALQMRLPTIFSMREFVEAGGLMSYGESARDFNRRAAFYVDKIMKGAKPADLPVQQPTRFFLVINRKTADAIGLTIPLQLLVLSDEVIQ